MRTIYNIKRILLPRVMVALCILGSFAKADETILFDSGLGTLPASQGWLYLATPLFSSSAVQTLEGGTTRLDTTPVITDSAGYFVTGHPQAPVLNRGQGYTIRFTLRIDQEAHVSTNRAGFSIIALSSDLKGIELGFWTNRVWAQNDSPLFTQGESGSIDTTAGLVQYQLVVYESNYWLSADGIQVLAGTLRDYTAFAGNPDPYETPNFIFLGDDTSSASADFRLTFVSSSLWPIQPIVPSITLTESNVYLVFSSLETGTTYQVQGNTNLISGAWFSSTNWMATNTQMNQIFSLPSPPETFWRVLSQP